MSKKKPLLIRAVTEGVNEENYKFLFKYGDDLRQDNLVLQMFKIMANMWAEDGLDLNLLAYDVMETGFETGYIEFVDKS